MLLSVYHTKLFSDPTGDFFIAPAEGLNKYYIIMLFSSEKTIVYEW